MILKLGSVPMYTFLKVTCILLLSCDNWIYQVKCYENPLLAPVPTQAPPSGHSEHNPELQPSHNGTTTSRFDSSAELVLGTFSQEMPNAWFYETYYPVLLKIPIPTWSADSLRLNRSSSKCYNDKFLPNYLCPAQFHLENLLLRLSQNTRFFKNIYMSSMVFGANQEDNIYDKDIHCLRIKPHFFHFSTTLKGIQPYIEELRERCPLAKNVALIEKTLSNDVQNATKAAYKVFTKFHLNSMEKRKFIQLIKSYANNSTNNSTTPGNSTISNNSTTPINSTAPINSTTPIIPATPKNTPKLNKGPTTDWKIIQMIGMSTFQNALTLSTYVDSVRWANAFATCQAYRLDIGLIPPDILVKLLQEAANNLTQLDLGYNISIPFDKLLTHFYKLPLTDCVLAIEGATDAFLILRLLLPVTPLYRHYKLVRLNKVPYFIRNIKLGNNTRELGSICEIKNYRYDDTYIVEYDTSSGIGKPSVASIIKAPPTCSPYHVCRIPDVVHRSLIDRCVEGVIRKNDEMTKVHCDFKCYPVTKKQVETEFPYVIQLTSNRFAIVGAMAEETNGQNVTIKCMGKMKVAVVKQSTMDEASIVTLPCPCEIVVGSRSYPAQRPCNGTLEIIHVTHVLEDEISGTKPKMPGGGGDTAFLGDTKHKKRNKRMNKDDKPDKPTNKKKDNTTMSGEEVWNPVVEYVEDDNIFHTPFTSIDKDKTVDQERLHVVDGSGGNGYCWSHIVIWTVGIILLISNIALLYVLYRNGIVTLDSVLLTSR